MRKKLVIAGIILMFITVIGAIVARHDSTAFWLFTIACLCAAIGTLAATYLPEKNNIIVPEPQEETHFTEPLTKRQRRRQRGKNKDGDL